MRRSLRGLSVICHPHATPILAIIPRVSSPSTIPSLREERPSRPGEQPRPFLGPFLGPPRGPNWGAPEATAGQKEGLGLSDMTSARPLNRDLLRRIRVMPEHQTGALLDLARRCTAPASEETQAPLMLIQIGGVEVEGTIKGGPLPLRRCLQLGLRRWVLGAPAPCEAEANHLTWLRKRLFRAADPLGSVTLHHLGFPSRELLVTRAVHGALPLREASAAADSSRRAQLFAEFGREVGRMHALRFLHAELHPGNVLATEPCDEPGPGFGRSLIWLGSAKGGPTAWRRGNLDRLEDDLGAWFSLAADWMQGEDTEALLLAYAASRLANGRPVSGLPSLVSSIQRSRRRELARFERSPRLLGGAEFPVAGWDPDVGRLQRLWDLGAHWALRPVVSGPDLV